MQGAGSAVPFLKNRWEVRGKGAYPCRIDRTSPDRCRHEISISSRYRNRTLVLENPRAAEATVACLGENLLRVHLAS